jgi:hypothetical protein
MRRAERRKELKKELNDLEEECADHLINYSYNKTSESVLYMKIAETHKKIVKARKAFDATFEPIFKKQT